MTSEIVPNLDKIPAFVDRIVVSGVARTDESLLKKQFRTLIKSDNLNDLFENVRDAKERLTKLGVFRYVFAIVDTADDPAKYKVIFKVEEKNPVTAKVSVTRSTDGTNKMYGSVRVNDLFRGAEFADLDLEVGTNWFASRCATLSKPLEGNPHVRFSVGATDGSWDHSWARFLRMERSVFAEVKAESSFGVHNFHWDAIWREIEAKDSSTPWSVRKESGPALKLGLQHTFERDSRSDSVFPESGFLCRLSNELSTITPGSPTGDDTPTVEENRALQFKMEGVAQKPFRLTDWLVGELTFSSGLTHSFTSHPIHIADRFFLGGPLEFRGFRWRSVGPVEPLLRPTQFNLPITDPISNDSIDVSANTTGASPIGSEGFWLAGGHLYTPLPYFDAVEGSFASHFRLHGFYQIGGTLDAPIQRLSNCFSSASGQSVTHRLRSELWSKPRTVLGAGLVFRLAGLLRIEVNYCIPIQSQPGDSTSPGFSFGLGMYYL
ncbi:unnamed protein product [Dicrocoelium dendriticum]|nr:unnamed protein product [Dicrocoelium dendriticum]